MASTNIYLDRIPAGSIYPKFWTLIQTLQENCLKRGVTYYATSGYRSVQEQDGLYSIGRTTAKDKKPVTKAKGGQSYHNFGIAIDFTADNDPKAGLQPDWNEKAYKVLAEEAEKLGLEAGAHWKTFPDFPHVQFKISTQNLTLPELKKIHDQGGIKAVWAYLDKHFP